MMMEVLKSVIGVLDMDGFEVDGEFYCKELGMMRIDDVQASSYLFHIPLRWGDLSERARRQCRFVTRNVHYLPFRVPEGVFARDLDELNEVIIDFYDQNRVDGDSRLAYKGGHYERDLLTRLGLPHLDLERIGCPKAEKLIDDLDWVETCGNHLFGRNNYKHCPKIEVEAFVHWFNTKLYD